MNRTSETKPFSPIDFEEELLSKIKEETKLQHITKLSTQQIQFQRKKYEDKIAKMKVDHRNALAKMKKDSYDAGYSAGHKDGLDENRKKVDKALTDLEKLANEIIASEKTFLKQAEQNLIHLALEISKRIILQEVQSDENIVVNIVRDALTQVADKSKIVILVNPDDLENIKSHRRELMDEDRDIEDLEFTPDPRIDPGECFVETKSGSVDGRFSSQMAEIKRKFDQNM